MRRKRGVVTRDRLAGATMEPVGQPIVHRSPVWAQVAAQDPGPVAATGQRLAPGGRRIVAWLIDVVVQWVLFYLPLLRLVETLAGTGWRADPVPSLLYTGVSILPGLVYFLVLWTGGRSTVGMRLMSIRVVDAASGGPVRMRAALRRWSLLEGVVVLLGFMSEVGLLTSTDVLGLSAAVAAMLWPIVLLVTTLTNPARQGLHDRYARTYVVRR